MKYIISFLALILILVTSCQSKIAQNHTTDFNFDWEFKLEDTVSNTYDTAYRKINLPHDWSIETPLDSVKGEGATGYFLGGIGHYKKDFNLNLNDNQVAYLVFDGVYNNATVHLNNQELGKHPYGYAPFYYDITNTLKNETNTVNVTVDRTRYADSRWYTGSGIYRNVNLITKNKLHIPVWGTFITTPNATKESATIQIETSIKNNYEESKDITVTTEIIDADQTKVGSLTSTLEVGKSSIKKNTAVLTIEQPRLWDME